MKDEIHKLIKEEFKLRILVCHIYYAYTLWVEAYCLILLWKK